MRPSGRLLGAARVCVALVLLGLCGCPERSLRPIAPDSATVSEDRLMGRWSEPDSAPGDGAVTIEHSKARPDPGWYRYVNDRMDGTSVSLDFRVVRAGDAFFMEFPPADPNAETKVYTFAAITLKGDVLTMNHWNGQQRGQLLDQPGIRWRAIATEDPQRKEKVIDLSPDEMFRFLEKNGGTFTEKYTELTRVKR